MDDRKEELETILDIYKLLKQDDSEYNLYNDFKLLVRPLLHLQGKWNLSAVQ